MKPLSVCIMGNSHAAALKLAWDETAEEFPDVNLSFFAIPGRWMQHYAHEDGRLVLRSPDLRRYAEAIRGGNSDIVLADYDAFVLVGLFIRFMPFIDLYQSHRLVEHVGTRPRQQPVSTGFLREFADETIAGSSAALLVGRLAAAGAGPVVLVPDPLPAISVLGGRRAARLPKPEQLLPAYEIYRQSLQAYAHTVGATVQEQPADTRAAGPFTRTEYTTGAKRANAAAAQREGQHVHMNAEYGKGVVRTLLTETLPRIGLSAREASEAAA